MLLKVHRGAEREEREDTVAEEAAEATSTTEAEGTGRMDAVTKDVEEPKEDIGVSSARTNLVLMV